jgi:hypothetical protein
LKTRAILKELQRYMSEEVRRYAHARGVRASDLVDVTEKTLQNWAKDNVE